MEEQYILARKINISPDVSNLLPDFERSIFVTLLMKEIREEEKALQNKNSQG